jgi:hypothetical protein
VAKFKEKFLARELRNKGESIGNIAKVLNVSKGSVSLWCQDIFLSRLQNEKLVKRNLGRVIANENKKRERLTRVNLYKAIGIKKVSDLSKRELFLVGAALYWAEGGKNQRKVVFINSDPNMILLWIRWATICLNIPNDRLICRVEINEINKHRLCVVESYWSNLTGIPLSQFTKASLKHSLVKKIYENNLNYSGSLQITVKRGTNLNYEILGYIEGLAGVTKETA